MVSRASGIGMQVGRFSRPQRGVGVLPMPVARLDTTPWVESVCEGPRGAAVLPLLVPGVAVDVISNRRCAADGVKVMC